MIERLLTAFVKVSSGLIIAISVCALHTVAAPAIIQNLKISGNQAFTSRQLTEELSSRPSLVYSSTVLQNDLRTIAERYRRSGYLDVNVSIAAAEYSTDSAFVDVAIAVQEGRQA
ncbi:MAG: POTRA domain-containing protein, partial [Bacteroidota bacterium]